jgi:hypothetical protein
MGLRLSRDRGRLARARGLGRVCRCEDTDAVDVLSSERRGEAAGVARRLAALESRISCDSRSGVATAPTGLRRDRCGGVAGRDLCVGHAGHDVVGADALNESRYENVHDLNPRRVAVDGREGPTAVASVGVVLDAHGNVYVCDYGDGIVDAAARGRIQQTKGTGTPSLTPARLNRLKRAVFSRPKRSVGSGAGRRDIDPLRLVPSVSLAGTPQQERPPYLRGAPREGVRTRGYANHPAQPRHSVGPTTTPSKARTESGIQLHTPSVGTTAYQETT